MSLSKEYLKNYAQKELELTGFSETPVGKTMLVLLENLTDITNGDATIMKQLCEWLPRMIDCMPICPITEEDFILECQLDNNIELSIMRCTRYYYIYQTADGKYWNDRAVAFKLKNSPETDLMFLYGDGGSRREITLPYYPITIIEDIDRESL